MTDQPDRYTEVARRIQRMDPSDRIGRGGAPKYDQVARDLDVSLIELVAVEIEDGKRRPGAYLGHPAHLPDDPKEMHAMFTSKASKDADLRRDMLEWAEINREVTVKSARALQTLVEAIQKANYLLNENPGTDAEQEQVWIWKKQLATYVRSIFGAEPDVAPVGGKLWQWCCAAVSVDNPTPDWLVARRAPPVEVKETPVSGLREASLREAKALADRVDNEETPPDE